MPKWTPLLLLLGLVILLGATYALFPPGRATPAASPTTAATPGTLVAQGAVLFHQFKCDTCHTVDGSRAAGPTLKGLAGSTVTLDTGQTVTADTQYLRRSILDPDSQVPKGYSPDVMSPAINDIIDQIEADHNLDALVAYIESLK